MPPPEFEPDELPPELLELLPELPPVPELLPEPEPLPEPPLELPRGWSFEPFGVPTPVGPSQPGPAVHWMLPHEPLLPLVTSLKADAFV